MSLMRLITVIGATITTSTLTLCYALEAIAGGNLRIPHHVYSVIAIATLVWWVALLGAICRDTINNHTDRRIRDILTALENAIEECGDRRANAARVETLHQAHQPLDRHPHLVR